MVSLEGKVAVVTGAGRGIGRGIAILLAHHGAKVVVNDFGGSGAGEGSDASVAQQVVNEIKNAGGTAVANHDSVASMDGGASIVGTAIREFGRIDILVNNAGILRDRMIFNMANEEWDAVINTRLASSACRRRTSGRGRRLDREPGTGDIFRGCRARCFARRGSARAKTHPIRGRRSARTATPTS
jgi:NAD(P)-dependent dehydrogenase (short-subunit alcohol dehydrogenase family)